MSNYLIAYALISIPVLGFFLTLCKAAARGDRMADEAVTSKLEEALEGEFGTEIGI